jgi:uncharacterized protein YaiE (UPF0345 family)
MALSYQNYTGDNTTTQFSIPFTYQNTAEISVTVDGVAETGLTFPSSSTVQLTSAPASGTLVQVRRTTDLSARAVDFASGSVLTEEDLDDSNIQVFHAAQESTDLAGDSIQLGNDNKWDAQSSVIKNVGTPTASTDAATKAYTDTEVAGVVSSAVTQATAAATTTAQAEVAAATSTIIPDATKLAIHPIGTQYTLSDGVTTDYSSKHYANVASTNATTATNAASAASTDASTASTAATDAQTAQAAAEAALDTFDDRFLGAKASDPSVDNDGNALLDGAIYFNTTSDIMKVYDATNTVWHDLALTGTDQTNVNLVAGQISPTNNIGTLAGISSDITTVAGNNANVTTVANSISDVNAVGTDIANVNTVATNLTNVNAFADTYFISPTAPASPTLGDLWFDTTNDIMKVYSSSGFVNAGSSVNGTANRYVYTATSGQTSFAATYDAGYVDVYLNGVKLQNGTDFTATDGSNVVLTVGAALNDQIDIVGYGTFNIAIPDISGDLTPQLGGDLATSGNDITFGDNDKAIFGAGSDLQIYHSGTNSFIYENGTGYLSLFGNGTDIRMQATGNENMLIANVNGSVDLYHDNSKKFETTSTGVDVTGSVTADGLTVANSVASADLVYFNNINPTASDVLRLNTAGNGSGTRILDVQSASTTHFMVRGDGNVGIGSASPTSKLSVVSGTNAGITVNDGTVNTILFNTSSANGSVGTTTNHPMAFYANNAERMRITSAGNVGISTGTPSQKLHVVGQAVISRGTGSAEGLSVGTTSSNTGTNFGTIDINGQAYSALYLRTGNSSRFSIFQAASYTNISTITAIPLTFGTSDTERMRIDGATGNVLVGTASSTRTARQQIYANSATEYTSLSCESQVSTNVRQVRFHNTNGLVGSINTNGSATSYLTSSDYRLKNNVTYDWDATTRLKQLKPARFAWIADGDDAVPVDGFLAHEVQDIVPEAITGTKDGMRDEEYTVSAATGDIYTPAVEATYDEDGVELTAAVDEVIHSADVEQPEELAEGQLWRETTAAVMGTRSVPDYQGIDQSKIVPLLVKTIQELEARITALENV